MFRSAPSLAIFVIPVTRTNGESHNWNTHKSVPYCTIKKLLLMILQNVLENKFERRFVDILSVCVGRSSKESESHSNRNKMRVKLNYSSKILDIINISSLISARDVKFKISEECCDYDIEIINKYNMPIGSHIYSYNRFLENLSEDDINDYSPCICERNSTHNKVREFI